MACTKRLNNMIYGSLIKNGDLQQLKEIFAGLTPDQKSLLVNKGFEIRWRKGLRDSTNPLYEAVKYDQVELVKFFLTCGAQPNTSAGLTNQSILHLAVCHNRIDIVETLLNFGADPNWKDSSSHGMEQSGTLPLYAACRNANMDIIKLLVDNGANVNIRDFRGDTGLFYAVRSMHLNVLRLLLSLGGNPYVKNAYGDTPSSLAHRIFPEGYQVLEEVLLKKTMVGRNPENKVECNGVDEQ